MKLTFFLDESRSEGSKIWEDNKILIAGAGVIVNDDLIAKATNIINNNGGKEIKGSDLWKRENSSLRAEVFDKVISRVNGIFHIANEGISFALDFLFEIIYHEEIGNFDFEVIRYLLADHLSANHYDFLVNLYKEWQLEETFNIQNAKDYLIKVIDEINYDANEKIRLVKHLNNINFTDNKHFRKIVESKITEAQVSDEQKKKIEDELNKNIEKNVVILGDNKHIAIISGVITDVERNFPFSNIIVDQSTKAMSKALKNLNDNFTCSISEKDSSNEPGLWIADWYVVFIRKSIYNLLHSDQMEKDFYKENIKICRTILKNCLDQSFQLNLLERYKLDRKTNPSGGSYASWLEEYLSSIE